MDQISNSNLILGDCAEKLLSIEPGTVDLTVTSPPYDKLRSYNGAVAIWGTKKWKDVISKLWRVTKEGGVVVWVVGDQTINGSETGTSFRQALYFKKIGFRIHDTMIYQKVNPVPNESAKRYQQCFEYMFVFSKGTPNTFNPIMEKAKLYGVVRPGNKNKTRMPDGSTKKMNFKVCNKQMKFKHNIFPYPLFKHTDHPAVFPTQLAHDHIITWSNPGDIVLDPFMGSGTVGIECKKLNRNFIGIEIDEGSFNLAQKDVQMTFIGRDIRSFIPAIEKRKEGAK